jgi:general nucleoside transport system permease protein
MSFQIGLERRYERSWLRNAVTPLLSVFGAFVCGAIFLAVEGFNPLTVYKALFEVGFTTRFGFTDSLTVAVPLILTGLAAAVPFRMNLFNIGAEGQLYLGAIFGSWAGLTLADGMPTIIGVGIVLVAGAVGGALWALPAAVFKAYYGTSEIITTLMLTFVALFLMRYLIFGSMSLWRDKESANFPQGRKLPPSARFELWSDTRLHWGLIVALGIVLVVWVLLRFTSVGFNMNVVGSAPEAARYAGISVSRTIIVALLISGALGGLAGATEVAGRAYALDPNGLELGLGFTGIVVASLARYNPFAIVVVATFLGGLRSAGLALQGLPGERVPVEVSLMLQGAILLFAIGGEVFSTYRLSIERSSAEVTA